MPYVHHNIIIEVVNRPPSGDATCFNNCMYNILSKVSEEVKFGCVTGDFDIDLRENISSDFINVIKSSGFLRTITQPIRL
ncbi:hypothetical protein HOLleu_36953 [Holothuria leucospilota]|uniref:Uncharacterized protein n=1 Tax=Holothuria leucospilota TaxID=206669 RepID=A0A9Q0YL04_HOLLE|nr:hypothetical protein HOLleu_36953 [Holothuria leucospilota]